jgi:hypothetical protein
VIVLFFYVGMSENMKRVGQMRDLEDYPIDDDILATFSSGTQVVSANRFGLSQWTITA